MAPFGFRTSFPIRARHSCRRTRRRSAWARLSSLSSAAIVRRRAKTRLARSLASAALWRTSLKVSVSALNAGVGVWPRRPLVLSRRPKAKPPHMRQIDFEFLMSGAVVLPWRQGRRLDEALQCSKRPCPGIALVAHECLQDREHGVVLFAIDIIDNAEQERSIWKTRHFGHEPQGLDLGIGTGLDPVTDFQQHLVGEDERGVVPPGADTVNIGCLDHELGPETRRRRERDSAALASVQFLASPQRRHYRRDEAFSSLRLIDQAGQGAAPQPCGGVD